MDTSKKICKVISWLFVIMVIFLQVGDIASSCFAIAADESTYNESTIPENLLHILETEFAEKRSMEALRKAVKKEASEFTLSLANEDGSITALTFGSPIRYLDKDGKYQFIDTSFVPVNRSNAKTTQYDYTNKSNAFHVEFSSDAGIGMNFDDAFTMSVAEISERTAEKGVVDFDENKDGRITYPSVFGNDIDVEYINTNRGIKENIILHKNTGKNAFSFYWASEAYHPVLAKDKKTIDIVSNASGEVVYALQSLLMYDSYRVSDNKDESSEEKHFSEDCFYDLTQTEENAYIITVNVSKEFLDSPTTVYPVIIDPSVTAVKTAANVQDTFVSAGTPNTNYGSDSYLRIGYYPYHASFAHKMFGFIKFNSLPNIGSNSFVTTASLKLWLCNGTTTAPQTALATVSGTWNEFGLTWNNKPNGCSPYVYAYPSSDITYYSYNATNIVKNWYTASNIGANIAYVNETQYDYNLLCSSDKELATAPLLVISYKTRTIYVNSYQQFANQDYSRDTAAQYAYTNAIESDLGIYDSYGIVDSNGYLKVKTAYNPLNDQNCTNFVSACLHEGGMIYLGSVLDDENINNWKYSTLYVYHSTAFYSGWYHYFATNTWGSASYFAKHWGIDLNNTNVGLKRGYKVIVYENAADALADWDYLYQSLNKGDVFQTASNNSPAHSMIVYDKFNNSIQYAQHTCNDGQNHWILENKLQEFSSVSGLKWLFYIMK